jgi:hypothetical protein
MMISSFKLISLVSENGNELDLFEPFEQTNMFQNMLQVQDTGL